MEIEESKNEKLFNNENIKKKEKKKYFRFEKTKIKKNEDEKDSKKIFRTKKDYHLSRIKAKRELKKLKLLNSKFISKTKNISNQKFNSPNKDKNSFIVKKVLPKKLKLIKVPKKEIKSINNSSNLKNNIILNIDNNSKIGEKNIDNYKIKLMFVYFSSIRNLCKYINQNLFSTTLTEQNEIDEFINQIYQSLQILDRKINEFRPYIQLKNNVNVNKEDFYDISSLKENLLLMKNTLNNSMSQNLINIYIDIDNFCKIYS
jgi:hypothetical protein